MELVFLGKEDDEETKALVGEDSDLPEMDDNMKNDPRGWWRQGADE